MKNTAWVIDSAAHLLVNSNFRCYFIPIKNLVLFLFFTCLLAICPVRVSSQNDYFRNINSSLGLSQNSVVGIALDSSGFVWMATQDGLNKYDGNSFTLYNKYFENFTPFNELQLGKLMVEHNGDLWIIPKSKIPECRNNMTGNFEPYPSLKNSICLLQRKNGDLLFGNISGKIKILNRNRQLKGDIELPLSGNINRTIYCISEDHLGRIWVASGAGIFLITENQNRFSVKQIHVESGEHNIYCYVFNNGSDVWVSTLGKGIYKKSLAEQNFKRVSKIGNITLPENLTVYSIISQRKNNIWFSTYAKGIYCFNPINNQAKQYVSNRSKTNWINYNYILSSMVDDDDNVWFGSDGDGVYVLENKFHFNILTKADAPREFNFSQARSIFADSNSIWVGNWQNGLFRITSSETELNWTKYKPEALNSSLDNCIGLQQAKNGDIYLATPYEGLYMKPRKSNKFQKIDIKEIASDQLLGINTIKYTEDNSLYLGTQKYGLIKYLIGQNKLIKFELLNDSSIGSSIRCIEPDNNGNIWIGFDNNGIGKFNLTTQKFSHVSKSNSSIPSVNIKCMRFDPSHNFLWIGTNDKGLLRLDLKTYKFEKYDISSGLSNNTIYGIELDRKSNIWVSSNKGISVLVFDSKLSNKEPLITNFREEDGLQSLEFNLGANFKDKKGNIYFGGINGINWFNPDLFKSLTPDSKCYISSILINQSKYKSGIETDKLKNLFLEYFENNLTFEVKTLDLENARKAKYRYKLDRFFNSWIQTGTNNYFTFTNLPPGEFTFSVSVSTDGVYWSSPTQLHLYIKTPWFKTWWFILTIFLFFASIGYWYYNYFIKARRASKNLEIEFQKEVDQLQSIALRSQMNPHFVFNCLNAIEYLIIKKDYSNALEYLNKFSKLLRFSLENSQRNQVLLKTEIEVINLYIELERLRFEDNFEFSINVSEELDPESIFIPPLIIQPIVENSIKHGLIPKMTNCFLSIDFVLEGTNMICIVEDNGIGRVQSERHKSSISINKISFGLKTTVQRLKILYHYSSDIDPFLIEDLYDESGQSEGTRVTLKIPLQTRKKD